MILELGKFALIFVLLFDILAVLSLSFYHFDRTRSQININLTIIKFLLVTIGFSSILYSFAISDFSVSIVTKYSSSIKPLLYKITGSWGNHEGSMLLWLWLFALNNFLFTIFNKINKSDKNYILISQSIIEGLFIWFILNYSDPFARIYPTPIEGNGLNPLLQDIGLAIHPPVLYFGYVCLSIPFSYSIVALIKGYANSLDTAKLRIQINISWICLTLGIMLGSWWAYRELGWGGFWFWDPVENISLMPWLICTALLHTNITVIKKQKFFKWFLFLSITAFCLSLVGSFLVRSGILMSVHSFASDPTRGVYLLLILFLISFISFTIFTIRIHKFSKSEIVDLYSKEFSILLNNALFITACATILIGTLYPIFYQFFDKELSVGEGYFINTFIPVFLAIIFLMAFSSSWIKGKILQKDVLIQLVISALITCVISQITDDYSLKYLLSLLISTYLIISMNYLLIKRNKNHSMILSHLLVGVVALAITINSYAKLEDCGYLKIGDEIKIGSYQATLKDVIYDKSDNYYIRKGKFIITKGFSELAILNPEFRFYTIEDTSSYEADIHHTLFGDIYLVIGEKKDDKYAVKIYYKPMINYIWFGVILMIIVNIYYLLRKNPRHILITQS